MIILKIYENWLTKQGQNKKNYNEFLYDNGFGAIYYICSKCDSYRLTPRPRGGMTPPEWICIDCGEMNYAPKWMSPDEYKDYLDDKEIKKNTKKYNI